MNGFDEFTEAVTQMAGTPSVVQKPGLNHVTVLGGGDDARLIAALCLAEGAEVTLFSAYGAELEALRASGGVSIRGAGPVGSYQIDRDKGPSIRITAELDRATQGADVIFLTGPVHKYRTYAMVLADHITDGQVIVLPQGRSLGALETAWLLRLGGCKVDFTLVEMQGLPYWTNASGTVLSLSEREPVIAATLPSGRTEIIEGLKRYFPKLSAAESVLVSGFSDGSALVEFPALLIAGHGGPDIPMGGQPLAENNSFANLLGGAHLSVISALADERRKVAAAFGVRNLPSDEAWIKTYAGDAKGQAARMVPSKEDQEKVLRDGVIGSLAPLASAAELTGMPIPMTQSMITLAGAVLGADIAGAGRKLNTIGIDASDVNSARRVMDKIAMGAG